MAGMFTADPTTSGIVAPGQQTASAALNPFTSGMSPDQVQALLGQYFQQTGVSPALGDWTNYWNQWGSKDPNYFTTRLLNGLQSQGGNLSAFQGSMNPTAPGGWGPGTAGYQGGGPAGVSPGGGLGGILGGGGSTLQALQGTPGYQFAQQAAMDAIQNSAAARGTLLTVGTLKALQGNAAGLAAAGTYFPTVNAYANLSALGQNAAAGM